MFITFEGCEGSGKSSQAKLLSKFFNDNSILHILTKEPGTPMVDSCKKIRALILDPDNAISPKTELFLYLADRAEHVSKCIKPALESGKWVISDRYQDSTFVYQGIGRGLRAGYGGYDGLKLMINFANQGVIPDITFIMDIPAEIGLKRAKESNKEFSGGDRMERENIIFHSNIRNGFIELAKTNSRYIVLDATKSIDELHEEIKTMLKVRKII